MGIGDALDPIHRGQDLRILEGPVSHKTSLISTSRTLRCTFGICHVMQSSHQSREAGINCIVINEKIEYWLKDLAQTHASSQSYNKNPLVRLAEAPSFLHMFLLTDCHSRPHAKAGAVVTMIFKFSILLLLLLLQDA